MHKYNILVHREIVYLDVFQIKLHKEEIKYPPKDNGISCFPATAPTEWQGDSRQIQYNAIALCTQVMTVLNGQIFLHLFNGRAFVWIGPTCGGSRRSLLLLRTSRVDHFRQLFTRALNDTPQSSQVFRVLKGHPTSNSQEAYYFHTFTLQGLHFR